MDRFYVEMSILTVNHIYNYNIGLFVYTYVNKMTANVFDNFLSDISDIHQHNTRNTTQKQFYITCRGMTRGQKTFSYCGPHIWNFIIKIINPNCGIGLFKNVSSVISCCQWWCYITLYITLFSSWRDFSLPAALESVIWQFPVWLVVGVSPEWWFFLFSFGVHVPFI